MRRLFLLGAVMAALALTSADAWALTGDVTGDGVFDLRDPLALCRFLAGTRPSLASPQNGDVNFDGALNRADVDVMMLAMVGVPLPPPPLTANPASIDFGDLLIGLDATRDITLTNNGGSSITVVSIALGAGSSASFSIVAAPSTPAAVPAGGHATITVRYAPTLAAPDTGSVVVLSGGGSSLTTSLKGRGIGSALNVAPTTLDFGDVPVGGEALLDTIIRNDGGADLTINSIAPAPGTSADFTIHAAPSTPFTLVQGAQATVTVAYAPAQTGIDSGSIDILTTGGSAAVTLRGRGVAPALDVNPTALDFGNILTGGSQGRSIVITNTGTAPLEVSGVGLQLGSSADFSLAPLPPTPFSIAPGDTQTVDVTYTPSGVGPDSGHVEVHTNAGDALVPLIGAGVAPVIDVVPQSLDFGNVMVAHVASLDLEIVNSGNADLSVSSISFLAGGSADFALLLVPSLPSVIPPGGSIMASVVYTPGQVGPDAAILEIASDDPATPSVQVPVSGNGVASGVLVQPNALVFSNVRAGHSLEIDFAIMNSGSVDLIVSALSLKAGSSADFSLPTPPAIPFTLTAGDTRMITVRYAPASAGTDTGAVSIDTSAGAAQVDLSGSAIAPKIGVTPPSIAFGNVKTGLQSTREITIANSGSDTLNVTGIALSGSAVISLSTPPSVPLALGPGGSVILHAVYAPGQDGPDSALLKIDSDDASSPSITVGLSGTGVSPHLTVTPIPLNFGDVSIGFSRTLPIQLKNTGTADLTIASPSIASGSSPTFAITSQPALQLAPGASTTIGVRFTPLAETGETGAIDITSDGGSASVPLSGNGIVGASIVSISIAPVSPLLAVGGCVQMHAVALLTDASMVDITGAGAWSSSDPNVATAGSTGLVTAIGPGASTITIFLGGAAAQTDVTVVPEGTLRISFPCGDLQPGATFTGEIVAGTGTLALGAYAIRIHYDPSVVKITGIDGGLSTGFTLPPGVDPATFTSGSTTIAAFQNTRLTTPVGGVSVARVAFEVIGAPGSASNLSLEALTLAATDITDIPWTNVPGRIAVAP